MFRSTNRLLGGLAALPLALILVTLGVGSASATTGGCFIPEFAAIQFADDDGFFNDVDLSDDEGIRKGQCKDFLKGCKKVVKHSTNCIEAASAAVEDGKLKECKDEDPELVDDCKSDVKADFDSVFDSIDASTADGYEICQFCYEGCLGEDFEFCPISF